MLCAPQITFKLTRGNRDCHWGNLQSLLWRIPLRREKRWEEREKYTPPKKPGLNRPAMEKYWYLMHILKKKTECTSNLHLKKDAWKGFRDTWVLSFFVVSIISVFLSVCVGVCDGEGGGACVITQDRWFPERLHYSLEISRLVSLALSTRAP